MTKIYNTISVILDKANKAEDILQIFLHLQIFSTAFKMSNVYEKKKKNLIEIFRDTPASVYPADVNYARRG